ncbi:Schwann cell myelin protein-like [Colossoma macropomum]|uniref:Schwann cell myelin protein-like n=1 Tax=Colossoma macropomum TaxID=42526 RepID=UPI001863BC5F|nr:Schwann cell myelin protein-like [Colossoma macropomum]
MTSTVVSGGLWTLVARAQFRANRLDHNRTLSCNSTFNGKSIYSTTVMLNILFPPSILMNSTCFVSAGGVQCVCRAEAEPQANIFWMVDGSSAVHPHFNTTTTYAGRTAVSELTGPRASNVSCKASNVVGTDTYQMPILCPLSEGNTGLMVAAVVAVVCIILGIAVAAICLKKRNPPTRACDLLESRNDACI